MDRILDEIGNIIRAKEIIPGKTLVIFDEIQACSNVVTSLKYFCENKRELHIICADSLLGVSIKREQISFPVGKIDRLLMYPMTFSEFLRADGKEAIYQNVQKYDLDRELPELYTTALEKELKYYYIVGGIPKVVAKWVETHNFEKIRALQDNILTDAGLVYRLKLVKNPKLPLSFYAAAAFFKVYMSDVGLLRKKSGVSHGIILEDAQLYKNFKGAFTENFVLTELTAQGISPYFWKSQNTAELDFLFEYETDIFPV